ncbi:MAG: aldehyde ferredoxin oxidoreductase [Anaerolineae bacterium]|nr:aldehyde ferredoxin oxidoreductase [Anaerolineae bacterium]
MKILMIDLTTGKTSERALPDPLMGGRWLTSTLVSDLVDPKTDPLGAGNVLVLACGALAGRRVSTGGRLSVGAKSPLTGGIKEANAGGMAGDSLAALGYRALVFTGACPAGKPAVAVLDENGVRLEDASPFWGMPNNEADLGLRQRFGEQFVCVSIGPAGEKKMKAAGIAVTDANDNPFRLAARGGLGAVMGAKGLKAVLVERIGRQNLNEGKDARSRVAEFNKLVATNERVVTMRAFGTASTVMPVQKLGGLPTRNYSEGSFEGVESISGETMRELTLARGGVGTPTEACMSGCVIQCSNLFPKPDGTLAAGPIEFETLGLCGSNLGLDSLDEIAELNRLCNDLGLDTIDVGAALGVMMEVAAEGSAPPPYDQMDLPRFGDGKRAAAVLAEIYTGGPLGELVGNGVVATGAALGARHVPAVKGQALSAYDPRVIKGTGVTYCTTPQGADHTAGLTLYSPVEHTDASTAVAASRATQIQRAAYDSLGLCVFNISAAGRQPEFLLNMLRSAYNADLPDDWLDITGLKVIRMERDFNRAAGMTAADDRLPAYFMTEVLSPRGTVFDVPEAELDAMWN